MPKLSTPRTPRPASTVVGLVAALALTVLAVVTWAGGDVASASWLMLGAMAAWTFGLARAQPRIRTSRSHRPRRLRVRRRQREGEG